MNKKEEILLASFVADALALGGHWVYDPEKIANEIEDIAKYHNPLSMFHTTKKAGDFTHYGDFSLFLLEFVKKASYDQDNFEEVLSKAWSEFISSYTGYFDGAARESLENYKKGIIPCGNTLIPDLNVCSRIAPLVYEFFDNRELIRQYALTQAIMTNNLPQTTLAVDATLDILFDVLDGNTPRKAVQNRLQDKSLAPIHALLHKGLDNKEDDIKAIYEFGPACGIDDGLPGAILFITRYENDLKTALLQNAKAGGDSSSRGVLIAMILSAHLGIDTLPKEWIGGMNASENIKELIA